MRLTENSNVKKYCQYEKQFHQNQGFIIIGTPGLTQGASTSGKGNSMESFPVMLDKVKKQFWRHSEPFLYSDACRILHILGFAAIFIWPMLCTYQLPSSHKRTDFQLDWGLVPEMAIAEYRFCCHATISVWILWYALGHCLAGKSTYSGVQRFGLSKW